MILFGKWRVLRDPGAGEGGGGGAGAVGNAGGASGAGTTLLGGTPSGTPSPSDWRSGLPEDLKLEPSLGQIKTVADLAKGYVHSQKMIGGEKLPKPQEKWTDGQWAEFYDNIGRPKLSMDYKFSEIKLEDGAKIDDARMNAAKEHFHKIGLTNKQADQMMQYYAGVINNDVKAANASKLQLQEQSLNSLKQQHGAKFNEVVDTARAALRQFGGDEILKLMEETGLGNDARVVNLFHKIGAMLVEDKAKGSGSGLLLPSETAAKAEIEARMKDPEFMDRYGNREKRDKDGNQIFGVDEHNAAVDEMNRLYKIAYPGQVS